MKKLYTAILGICVVGFFILLKLLGVGATLDSKSLDLFQTSHKPHPDLVILAIDNESISDIGRWPWDRSVFAKLLDQLSKSSPRAVGLDVTFSETQNFDNDAKLKASLDNAPFPITLAATAIYNNKEKTPKGFQKPLSYFYENPKVKLGVVNTSEGKDGLSRKFPVSLSAGSETLAPFSFAIASSVASQIPSSERFVAFSGPAGTIPTYSVSDVLNGSISSDTFKDKIILVGATASDLHDYLLAPVKNQTLSGVEWHANVIDNILEGRSKLVASSHVQLLVLIILGLLLILLFTFASIRVSLITALALLVALPLTSFILWTSGFAFPFAVLLLMALVLFVGQSLYHWYLTEKERRKIRRTMQNYFSPQVLEYVLKHPESLKLGGERKEVTIFFSDIRSFTTITESTEPEMLSKLLHDYFTEMTEEILKTDGVVDKFIGDAIMAFWGAPLSQEDQADRALKSALAMLEKLPALRERWKKKGWPEINIGIGIATGTATVGNMGSSKRFDYTVIGDSVNLAARLESATKEYKVQLVVSESTKLKAKSNYNFKHLGSTTVKGKTQPVEVYTIDNSPILE